MTHVTITKCQCGHASCNYHGLSNGSFDQGNGFDKETAERYAALWNGLEGIPDPAVVGEAIEALRRIQSLAAKCEHLPDTDGLRRAYRDIDAAAQIALAKLEGGEA